MVGRVHAVVGIFLLNPDGVGIVVSLSMPSVDMSVAKKGSSVWQTRFINCFLIPRF